MSKLSQQEEKELISFIKDWLKSHGFTQKDLAYELKIKSSRTSEIILQYLDLSGLLMSRYLIDYMALFVLFLDNHS